MAGADGADLKVGRATVIHVVDWEGDGDLDLVVGDIDGRVQVIRNASGDKTFKVGSVDPLSAGGTPISTPGRNSGPVVTDWDGDGRPDLLVGCGDGSVQFFRNTSDQGEPKLDAGVTLISKAQGDRSGGYRAKLAVVDWNADGKQDLLVGEYSSVVGKAPDLTPEQAKRKTELEQQRAELSARMKIQEADPRLAEDQRVAAKLAEVNQELRKFSGAPRTSHGYVWLFVRQ